MEKILICCQVRSVIVGLICCQVSYRSVIVGLLLSIVRKNYLENQQVSAGVYCMCLRCDVMPVSGCLA